MFKEYDCVVAKRDLSDNIKKGFKGTIVSDPSLGPNDLYLVEFFDNNKSIDIIEVQTIDIELLSS